MKSRAPWAVALATAALAPTAQAGTAEVTRTAPPNTVTIHYSAAPGEVNDVVIEQSGDNVVSIRDATAPVTPGADCSAVSANEVSCSFARQAGERGTLFEFRLADGDDSLRVSGGALRGGVLIEGGSGADALTGGDGDETFSGGEGDDRLAGRGGRDLMAGGPGADALDGGAGLDAASWRDSPDRVSVDLAAGSGGGDTLAGFESALGSPHDDILRGGAGSEVLEGHAGRDVIDGGGGDDRIDGGAGNDVLGGGAGADRLVGARGNDRLSGGGGSDRIAPGASGNDDRAGAFETVACGGGRDFVALPDRGDLLERDCEQVTVAGRFAKRADLTLFPRFARGAVVVEVPCPPGVADCSGTVSIRAQRGSARYGRATVSMHGNKRVRVRVPVRGGAPVLRLQLDLRIGRTRGGYSGGFSFRR